MTLDSGPRILPQRWALLPALIPATLVGAFGPLRNGDVWVAAAFAAAGFLVAAGGFAVYALMERHAYGHVTVRVDGGAVLVDAARRLQPKIRYRGLSNADPLPLAELVDAWVGELAEHGEDVRTLVLRFTGNRYVEIPAATHGEGDVAALAEELKALGRAAEARDGAVPDEVARLRQRERV